MKTRADQAHTVIIGEARSPVGVSLGLRLIGDEEVATVTITQRNKTTTLAFTDSAHAARIADALLGYQPYAVVVSRKEAEGERPPAPAVQGEPVAWSGWGCQYPGKMPRLYGDRRIAELNCDRENGDQVLYFTATSQPTEQKPAPDVTQLVEALERIASLPMNSCSTENDYRLSAAKALAAGVLADHRSQGGEA